MEDSQIRWTLYSLASAVLILHLVLLVEYYEFYDLQTGLLAAAGLASFIAVARRAKREHLRQLLLLTLGVTAGVVAGVCFRDRNAAQFTNWRYDELDWFIDQSVWIGWGALLSMCAARLRWGISAINQCLACLCPDRRRALCRAVSIAAISLLSCTFLAFPAFQEAVRVAQSQIIGTLPESTIGAAEHLAEGGLMVLRIMPIVGFPLCFVLVIGASTGDVVQSAGRDRS